LPPGKPLRELLHGLQDDQSRLMAYQHLGLVDIQAIDGRGELFDTLVVVENFPFERDGLAAEAGNLRLAGLAGHGPGHYPLSVMVVPGERLQLRLEYRPDLFARAEAEAIGARMVRLIEAMVAEPDRSIGRLDVLAPPERDQILRTWNDTARPLSSATVP